VVGSANGSQTDRGSCPSEKETGPIAWPHVGDQFQLRRATIMKLMATNALLGGIALTDESPANDTV